MNAILRNFTGAERAIRLRADLNSAELQTFLRQSSESGKPLEDVLCSLQFGRRVQLQAVRCAGGAFTTRSLAPGRFHRKGCPCWEGSHGGGSGNVGEFTYTNLLDANNDSADVWDDLSENWRSKSDFGGFSAWALSEASLRTFLSLNPNLSETGSRRGVEWQPVCAQLEKVLREPAFSGGISFEQLATEANSSWAFGLLPYDFLDRHGREAGAFGVMPHALQAPALGSISPGIFVSKKTALWSGRCRNIGGEITGPYFFLALSQVRSGYLFLSHLALIPVAHRHDVVAAVESRFERDCLHAHPQFLQTGFKPVLLSHLLDLYHGCGVPNADKLRVRVDVAVPQPKASAA